MADQAFTTEQYFLGDFARSLFPLSTTRTLVENFSTELKDHIQTKLIGKAPGFSAQQRCYAAKRGHNLRRTVKLDPASEFFLYDVVFRNRKSFRRDHRNNRRAYGYRFASGQPESASESYTQFKTAVAAARAQQELTLKADVATYFNSIYHHDLVQTVEKLGWSEPDVNGLGQFLREINAGRSVDCLPHGLHPAKALGAEFLRFVDDSVRLKSAIGVRFLDDVHFFDADEGTLIGDLGILQELLGEKGLSLNDMKTAIGRVSEVDVPQQVDDIKRDLLRMRRHAMDVSGEDLDEELEGERIDNEQLTYLLDLLQTPDVEESDAELVLVLLRDHAEAVFDRMGYLLTQYPGLTKATYHFARLADDKAGLDGAILNFLKNSPNATEYQLFWIAKIAEDFLGQSPLMGDVVSALIDHPKATTISLAKVYEIPDKRFGLPELRNEVLRSGCSDWKAWASAMGSRSEPASGRNHLLGYFAKGSPLNALVAECVRRL
jgi:hypothetical protein